MGRKLKFTPMQKIEALLYKIKKMELVEVIR